MNVNNDLVFIPLSNHRGCKILFPWNLNKHQFISIFMTNLWFITDDDSGEKSVSVLLSGEESEMTFIDHAYNEMTVSLMKTSLITIIWHVGCLQPENCLSSYDPHGFLVIYSSADKSSFLVAERVLQTLWASENISQKAVILVGNKVSLRRQKDKELKAFHYSIFFFSLGWFSAKSFGVVRRWVKPLQRDFIILHSQTIHEILRNWRSA